MAPFFNLLLHLPFLVAIFGNVTSVDADHFHPKKKEDILPNQHASLLGTTLSTTAQPKNKPNNNGAPIVIIIPGDGGSALETKFEKPHRPHFWCPSSTHGKWTRLWLKKTDLLPGKIACWSDTIKLHYDEEQAKTSADHPNLRTTAPTTTTPAASTGVSNGPGVQVRAIPGLEGLEVVDGDSTSNLYHPIVDAILKHQQTEQQGANTINLPPTVLAAPYDFRLSPRGNPDFLQNLKSMIETAYEKGKEKTKITLISHSLGCLFIHHFLTRIVSAEWKQRYIHAWIPISPAYGGTILDILQLLSGDTEGIPLLSGLDVRDEQRTYETNQWLLPHPALYGGKRVLVKTPFASYTAQDYHQLFTDANYALGPIIHNRIKNLTAIQPQGSSTNSTASVVLADPHVAVYPIWGTQVSTIEQFVYKKCQSKWIPSFLKKVWHFGNKNVFDQQPHKVTSMAGDGTVNQLSLQAGDGWDQSRPLSISGANHNGILSHKYALSYIVNIVFDKKKNQDREESSDKTHTAKEQR